MKHYQRAACVFLCAAPIYAADIVIHLPADTSIQRHTVTMQCDAAAVKLGVPESSFSVEYINALPSELAVLPIDGKPLVFAGVMSGPERVMPLAGISGGMPGAGVLRFQFRRAPGKREARAIWFCPANSNPAMPRQAK